MIKYWNVTVWDPSHLASSFLTLGCRVSFNTRANACQRVSPKWLCVQHRSVSTIRVSCLILKTRPSGKHFLGVEENIQVVRRFSLDLRSSLLHDQLSLRNRLYLRRYWY